MSAPPPAGPARWGRDLALGCAPWVGVHLGSMALLLGPQLQRLALQAGAQVQATQPHAVAFAAALTASIAGVGLLAAGLVRAAVGPGRPGAVLGLSTLLLLAVGAARVAERPALFEGLLWRQGGLRAALQVALVERLGAPLLWTALGLGLLGLLGLALRRARRPVRIAAGLVALLLGGQQLRWPRRAQAGLPSVVVLAADSLRADHLGGAGYGKATSPRLDALRKEAASFEDTTVPIASTIASWCSLLTGLYPHHHGVRDLFPRDEATRLFRPTLGSVLAQRGYQSAVVTDYAGDHFARLQLDFDVVDAPPYTSMALFGEREVLSQSPVALALWSGRWGQALFPVARYLPSNANPADLTERVLAQLDRLVDDGKPFFLVTFYSVTHAPFPAPPSDLALFTDPAYAGKSRYAYELQNFDDLARLGEQPAPLEATQVRALYDGAVHAFDREAGRVLDRLRDLGLGDAVVVVLGDHGENLFEPGTTTEHGKWFNGGLAAWRVPWLLKGPGVTPGPRLGLASGVDFMPTLLDAVGAPLPPDLDGQSLLKSPPAPDRLVFAETGIWLGGPASAPPGALPYPDLLTLLEAAPKSRALQVRRKYVDRTVEAKLRMARQGDWELVLQPTASAPLVRLYHLPTDPFTERDVSAAHPVEAARLHAALREWMAQDPLRWLDVGERTVPRVEQ